jgi:hypothetical protein
LKEASEQTSACYLLRAGFLLGSFFVPEDGSEIFLGFQRTTRRYIPENRTVVTLIIANTVKINYENKTLLK